MEEGYAETRAKRHSRLPCRSWLPADLRCHSEHGCIMSQYLIDWRSPAVFQGLHTMCKRLLYGPKVGGADCAEYLKLSARFLCAENKSTLNPDIDFINFQLTEKRRRRERLITTGAFERLSQAEQLLWSPRIVSLRWWPVKQALQALHPSNVHINDYQRREFERLGHSGRDVAVGTSHALKHLLEIGSFLAFQKQFLAPQLVQMPGYSTRGTSGPLLSFDHARRSRSWDSRLEHSGVQNASGAGAARHTRQLSGAQTAQVGTPVLFGDSVFTEQRARSGTAGLLEMSGQWLPPLQPKAPTAAHTGTVAAGQRSLTPASATESSRGDSSSPLLPLPSGRVYLQGVCSGRRHVPPLRGQPFAESSNQHDAKAEQKGHAQPSENNSMTILSYNLNALPVGASMVSSHSSHHTGERINAFVAHLAELLEQKRAPQVLALQEVFASPISPLVCFQAALLRRLDDLGFSFVARMPRPTAYDVLVHGKYTDSGLVVVSRLPICASDFHAFSTAGSGLDAGAAKGVVWARVLLSTTTAGGPRAEEDDEVMHAATTKELVVDIFNCHLQASHTSSGAYTAVRAAQMQEMIGFIKLRTHNSPFPFMLMGDFNVDGVAEQPGEHVGLPYFSSRLERVDAKHLAHNGQATSGVTDSAEYSRLYQQLQGAITRMPLAIGSFPSNAPLGAMVDVLKQRHGQQISTRPPRQQYPRSIQYAYVHKYPQRLDYLWYAEGEADQLVADIQSVQVHPFRIGGAPFRYLSDHYGLSVRLVQERLGTWLEAPEPIVVPLVHHEEVLSDLHSGSDDGEPVRLPSPPSLHPVGAQQPLAMRRSQSCVELSKPLMPVQANLRNTDSFSFASPGLPPRSTDVLRLVRDPAPDSWLSKAIFACSPRYWSYFSLFAYRSRAWAILHKVCATALLLLLVALSARVAVALLPCKATYMQTINDQIFIPVQQVCLAAQHTVEFPENAAQYLRASIQHALDTHLPWLDSGLNSMSHMAGTASWKLLRTATLSFPFLFGLVAVSVFTALVVSYEWTVSNAWCSMVHIAVHGPQIPNGLVSNMRHRVLRLVHHPLHLPSRLARVAEALALRGFHKLCASRRHPERLYNLAVIPAQGYASKLADWLFVTFVGRRPLRAVQGRRGASAGTCDCDYDCSCSRQHSAHKEGESLPGDFFVDDARSVSSQQRIMDSPTAFHAVHGADQILPPPLCQQSKLAEFLQKTTLQYLQWAGVHRPLSLHTTRKRGLKHETWKLHIFQLVEELSDFAVLPVLRWSLDQGSSAAMYGTRRSAERYVTEFTNDSSVASQRSVRLLRMRSATKPRGGSATDSGSAEPHGADDELRQSIPLPAAGGAVPIFTRQYAMLALLQRAMHDQLPSVSALLAAQRMVGGSSRAAIPGIQAGAAIPKLSFLPSTMPSIAQGAMDGVPNSLYASLLTGARQHGTRRAIGWLAEDEPTFLGSFSSAEVNGVSWWSFTDLLALASCFGAGLVRLGRLRPGSKVGILAVESREWVVADAACACFGLVSSALHCPSPEGLMALLDASGCDAILCSRRFIHAVMEWCAARDGASKPFLVQIQPIQYTERMAGLELGVSLHTMEFIVSAGKAHPLAHSPPLPDDIATEVFSWRASSDGGLLPVPIILTQRGLAAALTRFRRSTPGSLITAADTYLSQLPLPDMAERSIVHVCLQVGACVVFGVESTNAVLHQLNVVQPTMMATTPKLMEHLFCHFLRIRRSWSAWYRKVYIESFSQKSVSLFKSAAAVRRAMCVVQQHKPTTGASAQAGAESAQAPPPQQRTDLQADIENITTLLSPSQRWSDATFFQSAANLLGTANLKMLLVVCTRDSGGFSARPDVRDFAQVAMCTPVVEVFASQRFGVLFTKPVNMTPVVPHASSPVGVTQLSSQESPSDLTSARRSILEQSSRLSIGDLVPGLTAMLEPVPSAPGVLRVVIPAAQRSPNTGEVLDMLEDFGQPGGARLRLHQLSDGGGLLSDAVGIATPPPLCAAASLQEERADLQLITVDTGILLRQHISSDANNGAYVFCGVRDALVPVVQPCINDLPQLLCLQRLEQIVHCCCGMLQRVWVAMPPAIPVKSGWLQLPPLIVASVFPEQAYSWANECEVPSLTNAASAAAVCGHPATHAYVLQRVHESANLPCVHLSPLERSCLGGAAGVLLLADTLRPPCVTPQGGLNRPALWRAHRAACLELYAASYPSAVAGDREQAVQAACELHTM